MALAFALSLVGCGGGGGGPSGTTPPPGPAPATVTVSGRITFDRIPFDATLGNGLNPSAPIELPARGVVVEAISGTSAVATTTTNATGDYSFSVPSNTQVFIRAKAQMQKTGAAPTWDFRVLNNTNADALYVLDGSSFNSGVADSARNLRAGSGWGTTSYTGVRAAAPFAILDTVYKATTLITSASAAAVFEPLSLFWSQSNRSGTVNSNGDPIFCIDNGDVQTTFYTSGGDQDDCNGTILEGIYVLGAFEQGGAGVGGDTDEFDQHVVAHEFGHFVEVEFSRSDSVGGEHRDGDKLDLRVAFGEGWGNAFSGMVLNDPIYRDSFGGAAGDFSVNLEVDDSRFSEGWFSETSVQEILWDIFDATNESGDTLALGFAPIFSALTSEQRTTDALTSIFSFRTALEQVAPTASSGLNQLLSGEQINGTGEFGVGETNSGGTDTSVLPVYEPILRNQAEPPVCVRATNGVFNKLGYVKFFRLDLTAPSLVTISAVGAADPLTPGSQAAADPDIYVYRQGAVHVRGIAEGSSETIAQTQFAAGTYIIEVYDFLLASGTNPRCMTVSVTGP